MTVEVSEITAIDKLDELFKSNTPVILYVPAQYKQLPHNVLEQPWSAVFTSIKADDIAYSFSIEGERSVKVHTQYESMLQDFELSKRTLPVVFLNDYMGDDEQQFSIREKKIRQENIEKKLSFIPDVLQNYYGHLVVLGFSPEQSNEIDIDAFYDAFYNVRKETLLYFDTEGTISHDKTKEHLTDLVQADQMLLYEESLVNALSELSEKGTNKQDFYSDETVVFENSVGASLFINKKLIHLSSSDLLETRGFVQVLSREEAPEVLINDANRENYFYNFIKTSSTRPVWYGYANKYYLERSYQKTLMSIVTQDLKSKESITEKKPILLIGQNSSSKTITLGALAYEIYQQNEYPVLFIRNPDINLDQSMSSYRAIDKLLQILEDNGAKKVLIIWDNSSSPSQKEDVKRLNAAFANRGRKVVLVSSAYQQGDDFYKSRKVDQDGVIRVADFKIVEAAIALNKSELDGLKQLISDQTSIPIGQYEEWVKTQNENNLLTLLYRLLYSHIYAEIAAGFQKEIIWGTNNLVKDLKIALKTEDPFLGPMQIAFINAGFNLPAIQEKSSDETTDSIEKHVLRFCRLAAISSQRKVGLPLSLLLRVVDLGFGEDYRVFQQAIFDIPFLVVEPPDNDSSSFEYVVSFRTQLEAELFIQNYSISSEDQITEVSNLIVNVSASGLSGRLSELSVIERLIMNIGPNSSIEKYREKNRQFRPFYGQIIDALAELRRSGIVEPRLVCQEVVWIREVYGSRYKDEYTPEDRVKRLLEAQKLANEALNTLSADSVDYSRRRLAFSHNALIVELALIERRLVSIRSENETLGSSQISYYDYKSLSCSLQSVITSDPSNTYPYNALLGLFIDYYHEANDDDCRINALSEILTVIDDADSNQREIIDNEEFQNYKQQILKFAGSEKYQDYYEELLQKGFASGVHLKIRTMLRDAGIVNYSQAFSSDVEREVAQEVIALIRSNENVTKSHIGCQMILLNLTWLLYNNQPIFSEEKQFTKMNEEQWQIIYNICLNYERQFLSTTDKTFNSTTMYYLFALSSAQLGNYSESLAAFKKIDESKMVGQGRVKVWHILCDSEGSPLKFNGRVDRRYYDPERRIGYLSVGEISKERGVYFSEYNLHLSDIFQARTDFEVGINYIGFSAFRELEKQRSGKHNG